MLSGKKNKRDAEKEKFNQQIDALKSEILKVETEAKNYQKDLKEQIEQLKKQLAVSEQVKVIAKDNETIINSKQKEIEELKLLNQCAQKRISNLDSEKNKLQSAAQEDKSKLAKYLTIISGLKNNIEVLEKSKYEVDVLKTANQKLENEVKDLKTAKRKWEDEAELQESKKQKVIALLKELEENN